MDNRPITISYASAPAKGRIGPSLLVSLACLTGIQVLLGLSLLRLPEGASGGWGPPETVFAALVAGMSIIVASVYLAVALAGVMEYPSRVLIGMFGFAVAFAELPAHLWWLSVLWKARGFNFGPG